MHAAEIAPPSHAPGERFGDCTAAPAGTYDAYRLEIDERRVGAEEGARQTCWYARDIQFPVKCEGAIGASFELPEHRE